MARPYGPEKPESGVAPPTPGTAVLLGVRPDRYQPSPPSLWEWEGGETKADVSEQEDGRAVLGKLPGHTPTPQLGPWTPPSSSNHAPR